MNGGTQTPPGADLVQSLTATDLGRASGWNMVAVQKNLGHASINLTVDTYSQFSYEDQELAVDLLPEIDG